MYAGDEIYDDEVTSGPIPPHRSHVPGACWCGESHLDEPTDGTIERYRAATRSDATAELVGAANAVLLAARKYSFGPTMDEALARLDAALEREWKVRNG